MADRTVREYTTQAPAEYIGQFLQGGIFLTRRVFYKTNFKI